MTPDSPARVPPDGENPYPRIEGGGGPIGYTDPRWRAWQEGFSAGSGHLEVIAAKAFAAGRAAASPDPPDEDAIRADERERLSARVYENGWCPTCAAQPAPGGPIPGPDPGACPRCGGWRKAGMIHRCPAATPDPPDMTNMCEGESPDHKPGITPAASPDERLREAARVLVERSAAAVCQPGQFRDNVGEAQWRLSDAITATRAALAADREAPDEETA